RAWPEGSAGCERAGAVRHGSEQDSGGQPRLAARFVFTDSNSSKTQRSAVRLRWLPDRRYRYLKALTLLWLVRNMEWMRAPISTLATTALLACGLSACDDAARKPAQSKIPAAPQSTGAPAPANASAHSAPRQANQHPIDQNSIGPLPLWNPNAPKLKSLLPPAPQGKAWLIARVELKFKEGEQEYKAGHLETAR